MAETAVERRGVSIALACRAFGVSETCYRYSPKLKDENDVIADLLTGLTDAEAETLYRDALQLVENSSPRHTQRVIYFANIASLMEDMNRLPEAEEWLRKALELRRDLEGRERVALACIN